MNHILLSTRSHAECVTSLLGYTWQLLLIVHDSSPSVKLDRGADLHSAHCQNKGQIVSVLVLYGTHLLVYNQGTISRFVVMVTVGNPSPLHISVKSCNPKLNSKTYIQQLLPHLCDPGTMLHMFSNLLFYVFLPAKDRHVTQQASRLCIHSFAFSTSAFLMFFTLHKR